MTLQGSDGIVTMVVCGYNSCSSWVKASKLLYQQYRRHLIMKESDQSYPRKRFREDAEDCLIVCIDANENIYLSQANGKLLTKEVGMGMKEVLGEFTGQ
jgi:hypothetical protein